MDEWILSRHALLRMALREISENELRAVLDLPDQVIEGKRVDTRNFYRVVDGRPLAVVLAYNTDPPTVVTVMLDERSEG